MTDYLDLEDLLEIAREAVGRDVEVRDYGLLESALARPRASVFGQDSAVTVSMGEISDRALEHLAPSDRMIVMTRLRLLGAARALRDNGTIPPLVDDPSISYGARSGDLFAPETQPWLEAYEETLQQARHPEMLQAAE